MDTKGFDDLQKQLMDVAQNEAPQMIDDQVERMLTMVLADVKLLTPVDSGNLKRRWMISDIANGQGNVGTNVEYAEAVEKGFTHKPSGEFVQGAHMLEQSLEQADDRADNELSDFFDRLKSELDM
ncbi:HK97 gp10 family phage protein [Salsuginibacillus kocurii]|uniref:HK97 gp10 family phage protein n=1 Tax=Salsuginibacillus kocurii TaxID=427078 RepID=UPI0003670427|nr:HK97 gp10 family phage protein [Salsuginibacillus kocurii]